MAKNPSHLRLIVLLQHLMYASHWKKNDNFHFGTPEIFPFICFKIAWMGQINLKIFLGYKIALALFHGYFSASNSAAWLQISLIIQYLIPTNWHLSWAWRYIYNKLKRIGVKPPTVQLCCNTIFLGFPFKG